MFKRYVIRNILVSKLPKFVKQSNLPEESIAGLKSAVIDCKDHPKVLQSNADVVCFKHKIGYELFSEKF